MKRAKTRKMKKLLSFLCMLPIIATAQDSKTFTRDKEFYIRGNTAVVGNNILSKDSEKPFNDLEKINDEFKMRYVDIDNDQSTWSSSSAHLSLREGVKVVYAGLYWSGTYHGERSGKRLKDGQVYHKKLDDRAHDIRAVKLKLPGGTYENIQGSLIYDGEDATHNSISSRAPYACMADVTALVQGDINGQVTVANVSATQGEIIGGSSAGWLLYVVYEDETQPLQYVTTFHGFEFVNKKAIEVDFGNFQSSEKGELETAITIGALEGDGTLGRDEIGIFDPKTKVFVTLDNSVRASSNFFNSTITINDKRATNRIPNSLNTLGFDLAKIKIPTAQNAIIANSTGGVKMRFKTRSDRFFLFFTAFQTTISERYYKEKNNNATSVASTEQVVTAQPSKKVITNQQVAIAVPPAPDEPKPAYVAPEVVNKELASLLEKPSLKVENIGAGYYVVTNVFSNATNAENWMDVLTDKGFEPQMFFRPDNNYFYVFVDAGMNAAALYKKLEEVRTMPDLKESWMLKINLD
tara:strand:+ start:1795 stop:3360 length:1566 start_codon:yes stop_codon:yes gene_type:complete